MVSGHQLTLSGKLQALYVISSTVRLTIAISVTRFGTAREYVIDQVHNIIYIY